MFEKLLAGGLVLFLALPLLSGCAAPTASETSLVPGTANAVVRIQVAKLTTNPALVLAYGELAKTRTEWPQTFNDAIVELFDKTGLDLAGVSTAILFADVESSGQSKDIYAGIIATGHFDQPAIVAALQKQTKQTITTSDYKGLTVYAGVYTSEKDNMEMAFFGPGRLVMGTAKAVRDTIDVSKGDQKPLTGIIIDTLDRLGVVPIAAAFSMPRGLLDRFGTGDRQQFPLSLNTFQSIDVIGFSADLPGLTVNTRIDAHFSNAESVKDARDAIAGLIAVVRATAQDPGLKTALSNIQVTAADSWLSVRSVVALAEISALIGNMPAPK